MTVIKRVDETATQVDISLSTRSPRCKKKPRAIEISTAKMISQIRSLWWVFQGFWSDLNPALSFSILCPISLRTPKAASKSGLRFIITLKVLLASLFETDIALFAGPITSGAFSMKSSSEIAEAPTSSSSSTFLFSSLSS